MTSNKAYASINRLSAYLFEITSNQTYLSAATLSADFVRAHMYTRGAILDTIRLSTNSLNCSNLNFYSYSHVTGYTILGLAVLASHDASYETL